MVVRIRYARGLLLAMQGRVVPGDAGFRVAKAPPHSLGPEVQKFVRVGTPKVILEHVTIIDA
jgi:hypothetical protein